MSKPITQLFVEHPASVGESYFGHLRSAGGFSLRMIMGGLACLVHSVLPFLFVTTGKKTISELHDSMVVNRDRRLQPSDKQS